MVQAVAESRSSTPAATQAGGDATSTPNEGATLGLETGRPLFWRITVEHLTLGLGFVMLIGASIIIYSLLQEVSWTDIELSLGRIGWRDIALAALATAVSYTALVGYDAVALRLVAPGTVPARAIAFTSFVSHAFTFTLGFGILTGGAVRLRLYREFGLSTAQVVAIGLICTLSFWAGLVAAAALALSVDPFALASVDGLGPGVNRGLGLALLAAFGVWLALAHNRRRSVTLSGFVTPLPGTGATLSAVAIGLADTIAAALALWLLLPAGPDPAFAGFLVLFAVATVLGVVSHAPGGIGVFEAAILLGLPHLPPAELVGSLLLFRLIYYVAPLVLATVLAAGHEVARSRVRLGMVARGVGSTVSALARPLAPRAAAIAVFGGGVVLLLSGATPAEHDRIRLLRDLVPLPFVETSHLAASITGLVLLVVAHGLLRRMANAWRLAVLLLAAGAAFSLLKGLDFEEAIVCCAVIGLLLVSRREFYRQADLFSVRPSLRWILAVIVAVGSSVWLGLFVWRNVEYQDLLWWDFAFHADAPRFMRATIGVVATALGIAAYVLLHRAAVSFAPAPEEERAEVRALVARSSRCDAELALLGDKAFLFSPDRQGFVMYAVQGRTFVGMGDPLAPDDQVEDLVWAFRELVDRQGGTPVFYQVSTNHLPIYLDAGFSLAKLGEEAWVDLATFTLEGSLGRKLRQSRAKAERSGSRLEIVPASGARAILTELEAVSEAWLEGKSNREKGFSLGFWDPEAVASHDVAVVRWENRIVAFATIWQTHDRREFSVDLMRHAPDAPGGAMDLLFIGLMTEAKARGFVWFNLGMAPLSGLPTHRLASSWNRLGALLYRRGNRFYNFEGLRSFKDKFKPEWRPRYLAFPSGLALPQILVDVTGLIAASPRRALASGG